jgi:hypothetical protein
MRGAVRCDRHTQGLAKTRHQRVAGRRGERLFCGARGCRLYGNVPISVRIRFIRVFTIQGRVEIRGTGESSRVDEGRSSVDLSSMAGSVRRRYHGSVYDGYACGYD